MTSSSTLSLYTPYSPDGPASPRQAASFVGGTAAEQVDIFKEPCVGVCHVSSLKFPDKQSS